MGLDPTVPVYGALTAPAWSLAHRTECGFCKPACLWPEFHSYPDKDHGFLPKSTGAQRPPGWGPRPPCLNLIVYPPYFRFCWKEGLYWGVSCRGWATESHSTHLLHKVPPDSPSQLSLSLKTGSSQPSHKSHTLGVKPLTLYQSAQEKQHPLPAPRLLRSERRNLRVRP